MASQDMNIFIEGIYNILRLSMPDASWVAVEQT